MSRTGLFGPLSIAGVLHAAVLIVPIYLQPPEPPEPAVEVQLQMPPPEPEPPPPEPEPEPEIEPPPPDPPPPPPEPKPKPKPKREPKDEPPPPEPPPEPRAEPPPPEPPPVEAGDNAPVAAPKVADRPPRPHEPPAPPPDMGRYGRGVHGSLMKNRRYPAAARRLGMEGTTKVKFTIDRKGRLIGKPEVVRSCGHELLDAEALRMVRDSAPFAPLPDNFPKSTATLTLPLKFSLER